MSAPALCCLCQAKLQGSPAEKAAVLFFYFSKNLLFASYGVGWCGEKVLPGCCGKTRFPNDLYVFEVYRSMP
jgi:hypothetical protein